MRRDETGYKLVRLPRATYDALIRIKQVVEERGVTCLPEGLRMTVSSLGDAVELGVRAVDKVLKGAK